jgi:D-sedoheptulose 7-phosphate isomerase
MGNLDILIDKRIGMYNRMLKEKELLSKIREVGELIRSTVKSGAIVLICGNGGSAAEALHLSGEIIGRFQVERQGLPAVALCADCATISAIGNDYGFDEVFARQVTAFKDSAKLLILLSTSGNSKNLIKAALNGKTNGMKTVGLLGKDGGELKKCCDIPIVIPSNITAEIQEAHLMIIHIVCGIMEEQQDE